MAEQVCPGCKHARRAHSRDGCAEIVDMQRGTECRCKKKYMEGTSWPQGTPKIG